MPAPPPALTPIPTSRPQPNPQPLLHNAEWDSLDPLGRARVTEAEMAEGLVAFLLPDKKRTLKTLIDILKSFGVILGIVVLAEYFNGKVPRAFEGFISPGVPSEVTSVTAQIAEGGAAILFVLVVVQTLGFIWRPLALAPVKWVTRLSTRTRPEVQTNRWKRLLIAVIDGTFHNLSYWVIVSVIALLVHLAHLGDRADEETYSEKGAALVLKLDKGG